MSASFARFGTRLRAIRRAGGALTMAGLGVVALALAMGLFACSNERRAEPDFSAPDIPGADLVVAEVNGKPVTAGELYHKIRLQYPQMPQSGPGLGLQAREMVLASVDDRCLSAYAREHGIEQDDEYRRMMFLSSHFIMNRLIEQKIRAQATPSEAQMRVWYEEHLDQFTRPGQLYYHHMLFDSQSQAQAARQRLLAGADFEEMAKRESRDAESAPNGGRMNVFRYDSAETLPRRFPQVLQALESMQEGEISQPVRTTLGWHLLRLDARRGETVKSFEEMRPGIYDKFAAPIESERFQTVLDSLKAAYRVKIHDDRLEEFFYLQMNADQLLQAARGEQDPGKRVRLYQELLDRYPQSPRVPEAKFLIGYEYSQSMHDAARAREQLERFLREHPDHPLAAAAQALLRGEQVPAPGSAPPAQSVPPAAAPAGR